MATGVLALEFAARLDGVCIGAAALRANRLAVRFRPTELAERGERTILARLVDLAKAQRAGGGAEKEVLSHDHHHIRCKLHRL